MRQSADGNHAHQSLQFGHRACAYHLNVHMQLCFLEFLLPVICNFEQESELTLTLDRPVHRSLLAGKSCELQAFNSRVQLSLLSQARVAEADAMQKV